LLTLFERGIRIVLTWLSARGHFMTGFFENFILLVEVTMVVVQLSINSGGHLPLTKI
jgi:hypothetical protein